MCTDLPVPSDSGCVVLLDVSLKVGKHRDPRLDPIHVGLVPKHRLAVTTRSSLQGTAGWT